MEPSKDNPMRKQIGRILGVVVTLSAIVALTFVVLETDRNPRTDDANVRANFIEIAAEVNGRTVKLPVKDNAHVAKGDLLFGIDPRSYQYALEQALSDQASLEQQIVDERRRIAASKVVFKPPRLACASPPPECRPLAPTSMSRKPQFRAPKPPLPLPKLSSR